MNMNQLQYFVSVADTLNFTKAAERCFISQTAMTQQIKALEQTVGVPLFIRDKKHVELTAAGRVYLNEARAILERSNDALKLARLAADGVQGSLSIGYVGGFGQTDFAIPLRKFHKAYPSIKLELFSDTMNGLFDCLRRGECDLIFTVSPFERETAPEYGGLLSRYYKSYPVVAMLPAGHNLASREMLAYSDLAGEDFVMMEPKNSLKGQMIESMLFYDRGGFYPNIVALEDKPETLILMIAVGMGISILPEYLARPYRDFKGLKAIPLVKADGVTESVDFEIDWRADNTNPVVEHLLEMFK